VLQLAVHDVAIVERFLDQRFFMFALPKQVVEVPDRSRKAHEALIRLEQPKQNMRLVPQSEPASVAP
jgi:hypothetical protein